MLHEKLPTYLSRELLLLLTLFLINFNAVKYVQANKSYIRRTRSLQEKSNTATTTTTAVTTTTNNEKQKKTQEQTQKKPLIPRTLWVNVYNQPHRTTPTDKMFDSNISHTINKYDDIWNDNKNTNDNDILVETTLSTDKCVETIKKLPMKGASTTLLQYYIKNDPYRYICRLSVLFLHGGYCLNRGVKVIHPYDTSINDDITFVGVTVTNTNTTNDNNLFDVEGSFIASTPYNAIIYRAIKKYIMISTGELNLKNEVVSPGSTFSEIMRMSLNEVMTINKSNNPRSGNNNIILLSSEHLNKLQKQDIEFSKATDKAFISKQDGEGEYCDRVIVDRTTKKIFFYTTFPGASPPLCDIKKEVMVSSSPKPKPNIIPHKLWFVSKHQLPNAQQRLTGNNNNYKKHYGNIQNTIEAYKKVWNVQKEELVDYQIIDNISCMNEISSLSIDGASSILFEYYMKEYNEDINKSFDICRCYIIKIRWLFFQC